jgi:hypothetical protein
MILTLPQTSQESRVGTWTALEYRHYFYCQNTPKAEASGPVTHGNDSVLGPDLTGADLKFCPPCSGHPGKPATGVVAHGDVHCQVQCRAALQLYYPQHVRQRGIRASLPTVSAHPCSCPPSRSSAYQRSGLFPCPGPLQSLTWPPVHAPCFPLTHDTWCPLVPNRYSPNIKKIEVLSRTKAGRSKLGYLRNRAPKEFRVT